ncbi:RNA-directed DNA polymerase, eukaryota, reverse transcriptase zinc-binding domain protein [Tanacetum coccineum]
MWTIWSHDEDDICRMEFTSSDIGVSEGRGVNASCVNDLSKITYKVDFDGGIETEVIEQSKDKNVMGEEIVVSKENMENVDKVVGNDCNPISSGNDGEEGSKEDVTKNVSLENMNDEERIVTDSVTTEEVISNPNSHGNDNNAAINDNGEEVVLFEEELVKDSSEKWKYTVCGYFVGCRMGVNELRYNLRRMWGKFGLKDIVVDADGLCYFKFKQEDGMNSVIDQSPWLVNAWNIKGISTIASRLGRPIKMDKMTADMCKAGTGRLGYARVLVEINVEKSYIDNVEINYVDDLKKLGIRGMLEIREIWETKDIRGLIMVSERIFVPKENVKFAYQPKVYVPKVQDNVSHDKSNNESTTESPKIWKVSKENVNEIRKSANKYAALADENIEECQADPFIDKRLIVDEFIKKKIQPNCVETKDWTYDMIQYLKYQWKAMEKMENADSKEDDVFDSRNQAVNNLIVDEVVVNGDSNGFFL